MSIITDSASLAEFCHRLSNSDYVTVDTEFIREKTYWPQLCLVQLANKKEAKVIDATNIPITALDTISFIVL